MYRWLEKSIQFSLDNYPFLRAILWFNVVLSGSFYCLFFFFPSVILPTSAWTKWQEFWRLKMHLVPNSRAFFYLILGLNTSLITVTSKLCFTTIFSPKRMKLIIFPTLLDLLSIQMIKVLVEKLIGKSSQEKGDI